MQSEPGDSETLEDLVTMTVKFANTKGLPADGIGVSIDVNDPEESCVVVWLTCDIYDVAESDVISGIVEIPGVDYAEGQRTVRAAVIRLLRGLTDLPDGATGTTAEA